MRYHRRATLGSLRRNGHCASTRLFCSWPSPHTTGQDTSGPPPPTEGLVGIALWTSGARTTTTVPSRPARAERGVE